MKPRKKKPRAAPRSPHRSQPLLSLNIIVRDEAGCIARCLRSVSGVVDEIVVVDTGSTDETMPIAKTFGARVCEFPWRDDFSAARNHGLLHCRGQWVLTLDADEQLDSETTDLIRPAILEPGRDLYYLRVLNLLPGGLTGSEVRLIRLFRNVPGTCYMGRIHEQLVQNLPSSVGGILDTRVLHYGYDPALMAKKDKISRNMRLLQLGLAETEQSGSVMLRSAYLHYWALGAEGAEKLRRLEDFAQFAGSHQAELKQSMPWIPSGLLQYTVALLNAGRTGEAAQVAQRILRDFGEAPFLHAFLGAAHLAKGDFAAAERELRIAMHPEALWDPRHREYVVTSDVATSLAPLTLARCFERQERWAEAEAAYRVLPAEMESARRHLIRVQMMQRKYQDALNTIDGTIGEKQTPHPDLVCLAFILSLIVQSSKGLLWWGVHLREAAANHARCRTVLARVEQGMPDRPYQPDDFPELQEIVSG